MKEEVNKEEVNNGVTYTVKTDSQRTTRKETTGLSEVTRGTEPLGKLQISLEPKCQSAAPLQNS